MAVDVSGKGITTEFPSAVTSSNVVFVDVKWSVFIGIIIFIILYPFYRHKNSCYNAIAARSLLRFLRLFILIELILIIILFTYYLNYEKLIQYNSIFAYGNGDDWLYGYSRPTFGLCFIGIGLFGELHPAIRITCLIGALFQFTCDFFSAYEVHNYYYQVEHLDAPNHGYSHRMYATYYWRDIISTCVNIIIALICCQLCIIIGWCEPQLIHPSLISSKDLDRYQSMHYSRAMRHQMEGMGIIESNQKFLQKYFNRQHRQNKKQKAKNSRHPSNNLSGDTIHETAMNNHEDVEDVGKDDIETHLLNNDHRVNHDHDHDHIDNDLDREKTNNDHNNDTSTVSHTIATKPPILSFQSISDSLLSFRFISKHSIKPSSNNNTPRRSGSNQVLPLEEEDGSSFEEHDPLL